MKTKFEIMTLLNCSLSKLDGLIKTKSIPYYKIGDSVRFKEKEVLEWIEKKRV